MRRLRPLEALLLIAPLLLLPALLSWMSAGDEDRYRYPTPPSRTVNLVVLTPHQKAILVEFEEAFRRWLYEREGVGVDIQWVDQSGSTALRYIREQYAHRGDGAGIGIDLLFGAGIDPYEQLKEEGRLEPFVPPEGLLDGIPADVGGFPLYDKDGTWYGTCLTGFGIMLNERVFELTPELAGLEVDDWEDLADPRLAGWLGSSDPRTSSSAHVCYEILLQAYGFERGLDLARRVGGNVRAFSKTSSEIPRLCAVGEVACGLTIDFYALAQIQQVGPVIRFVLPAGNTLVNGDAIGMLSGCPNKEAARWFMEYMLTEDAARLWMLRVGEEGGPRWSEINRGAVRPATYVECAGRSNVTDNPFAKEYSFRYDSQLAGRRWNLVNDMIGALIIDPHADLKRALRALDLAAPGAKPALERKLFALPMSELEVNDMADRWSDAEFRAVKRAEWSDFARARYREVAASDGDAR